MSKTRLCGLGLLLLCLAVGMAHAVPGYAGGSGVISFGVAPYGGAPNIGGPTYIPNNFTLRNDILSSPGLGTLGGYLTASPIIANNIASYGPVGLPMAAWQVGGGNINGAFGSAASNNLGATMGYALNDVLPGSGSATYIVNSGITTWTDVAGTAAGQTYGAWLTMAGAVPLIGHADVASLKVHLSSANPASPFFGGGLGVDLPDLVLAISRNGGTNTLLDYNVVTIGGIGGLNAGLIVDNTFNGAFRAAAVDTLVLANPIPAGDVITARATLTAYSDPASMNSFDTMPLDLLALTGPLPTNSFASMDEISVPEPAAMAMIMIAGVALLRRSRRA